MQSGTGAPWQAVASLPTHLGVQAVAIPRATDWVVIANPYLLATADAGRHWTRTLTTPRIDGPDLAVADGQHGWILQPGACPAFSCPSELLATSDGGRTWKPLMNPRVSAAQRRTRRSAPTQANRSATADFRPERSSPQGYLG